MSIILICIALIEQVQQFAAIVQWSSIYCFYFYQEELGISFFEDSKFSDME